MNKKRKIMSVELKVALFIGIFLLTSIGFAQSTQTQCFSLRFEYDNGGISLIGGKVVV